MREEIRRGFNDEDFSYISSEAIGKSAKSRCQLSSKCLNLKKKKSDIDLNIATK